MKFTTLIPIARNDGRPVAPSALRRVIDNVWRPFEAMTNEGLVEGYWLDADGTMFHDVCVKIAIECGRERLNEAIKAVKRAGRQLGQRAMFFEVTGYDGVQILRIERP